MLTRMLRPSHSFSLFICAAEEKAEEKAEESEGKEARGEREARREEEEEISSSCGQTLACVPTPLLLTLSNPSLFDSILSSSTEERRLSKSFRRLKTGRAQRALSCSLSLPSSPLCTSSLSFTHIHTEALLLLLTLAASAASSALEKVTKPKPLDLCVHAHNQLGRKQGRADPGARERPYRERWKGR